MLAVGLRAPSSRSGAAGSRQNLGRDRGCDERTDEGRGNVDQALEATAPKIVDAGARILTSGQMTHRPTEKKRSFAGRLVLASTFLLVIFVSAYVGWTLYPESMGGIVTLVYVVLMIGAAPPWYKLPALPWQHPSHQPNDVR